MTLRELLALDKLQVVELVAGSSGLDRNVSCAVMFDNPDMVQWMRSGEIMLTTGYFLQNNPQQQLQIIRELAGGKSGGLVIKVRRYFDEIPAAMIECANALGFPLMQIPYHVSLSELSELVNKCVYGVDDSAKPLQLIYQTLFDMLQNSCDIQQLLNKCDDLLNTSFVFLDLKLQIKYASASVLHDPSSRFAPGWALFPENTVQAFTQEVCTSGFRAVSRRLNIHDERIVRLYPIHSDDELLGYLGIIPFEVSPPNENDDKVFWRIATALSIVLLKERSVLSYRPREIEQFLDGLVTEGALSYSDVVKSANYCNIHIQAPYLCCVITFPGQSKLVQTAEWLGNKSLLRKRLISTWEMLSGNSCYLHVKNNNVIFLLAQNPNQTAAEQVALADEFCRNIYRTMAEQGQGESVYFGIGEPTATIAEFYRSYSQALRAVDLTMRLQDEHIGKYRRYILYELIYDSPNAKLALVERLRPLQEYDESHNTQLLHTLETYFNNCQNSNHTSSALFIHRNTLLYRLDKISEILALDFTDSEQLLILQLALKAFLVCK